MIENNDIARVYVWDGLNEVEYKSISVYFSEDETPKEIICPITAKLNKIKAKKSH